MRKTLLTSATLLGLAASLPAFGQAAWPWAHQPGTGESGPGSSTASNIDSSDAHATIAPHLPEPAQGEGAGPEAYLHDAQNALMRHQTGLAQQSLEMAETRLLDRSTLPADASTPDQSPEIQDVTKALNALAHHDWEGTRQAIHMALASAPATPNTGMTGPVTYTPPPASSAPAQPDTYTPPDGSTAGGMNDR